jgi:hypothetical protein
LFGIPRASFESAGYSSFSTALKKCACSEHAPLCFGRISRLSLHCWLSFRFPRSLPIGAKKEPRQLRRATRNVEEMTAIKQAMAENRLEDVPTDTVGQEPNACAKSCQAPTAR